MTRALLHPALFLLSVLLLAPAAWTHAEGKRDDVHRSPRATVRTANPTSSQPARSGVTVIDAPARDAGGLDLRWMSPADAFALWPS